ncbi:nucleoside triphosphate pyrophosphohydrolase [Haloarcula argentinensis]|uniref:Phosphoribosyl-ATP pyrophosphohydrolase n=1 Tax=Haloarcula argentinensis TaxID=43776 RepID=A0A847UNL3_HALAR|nr:nucleoside triphosphate pyrophosphohydrolase [Haloarcula argentinensis]NLV14136.1 hypothetical protein [Haloarcula argentinensis]
MVRKFDKLVRDKIPEVIEDNGETPTVSLAGEDEYSERLVDKLEEEVAEYRESHDIEELVDILEVIHAIRKDRGLTREELQDERALKAEQRGRFDEGIVLERVDE